MYKLYRSGDGRLAFNGWRGKRDTSGEAVYLHHRSSLLGDGSGKLEHERKWSTGRAVQMHSYGYVDTVLYPADIPTSAGFWNSCAPAPPPSYWPCCCCISNWSRSLTGKPALLLYNHVLVKNAAIGPISMASY